ncbi:cutinase family protein [Cellulomonas sp. PSBB021]|uniref:cutinase family protein n=1 Tax=Cellulomonas sp. PSBB021 TaxID=2003551 RepID=UPI0012FE3C79|nr:cutinase family protein [Cellulomonas sp. PSBB021]
MPTLRARASALLAVLPLVVALVAAPSAATPSSSPVSSPPAPTGRCTDLLVLSIRGSGESSSATKTSAVRDAFLDGVDGRRTTTVETLPYPAAAMSVLADDFRQLIDLGLPGTSDWSYFRSIETGAQVLRERLSTARRTCPDQKWALIGYSQGAMVISEVLPSSPTRSCTRASCWSRTRHGRRATGRTTSAPPCRGTG